MLKRYKFSEESRKRMSEAQRKRMSNSEERKRFLKSRITNGMSGKRHSEESREKMSEALKGKVPWMKGKKHTPEELLKMGESHKGQIAWNKGLKGVSISGMKGKNQSEEAKRKMSEGHKGKSTWNAGKKGLQVAWNKGIPMKEESRKKMTEAWRKTFLSNPEVKKRMRESHKGQIAWNKGLLGFMAGEKSPLWKGGISFEPYSLEWTKALKKIIKERDGHTCRLCNKKGNVVHHIDYNKKNCNPENLITLCGSCHSKTNVNREKWSEFFKSK